MVPLASVQTENFYTPLYTNSHETSHDNNSAHKEVVHDTHPTSEEAAVSAKVEVAATTIKV